MASKSFICLFIDNSIFSEVSSELEVELILNFENTSLVELAHGRRLGLF